MQSARFRLVDLAVAVSLSGLCLALLAPGIARARSTVQAASCRNNFKMIGIAMHNYHDTYARFPPGNIWADPKTLTKDPRNSSVDWGVGVKVLPYLEQYGLYNSVNFSLSWHAVANRTACVTRVAAFLCPEDAATTSTATLMPPGQATNVVFPLGSLAWTTHPDANRGPKPEGLFFDNSYVAARDITDGLSNTVMASEQLIDQVRRGGPGDGGDCAGPAVEPKSFEDRTGTRWMTGHPSSNYFNARRTPNHPDPDCFEGVSPTGIGSLNKVPRSLHPNGVHVLRADGGIAFVQNNIELAVWQAVNTRAGNEVVDPAALQMMPAPSQRPVPRTPRPPAATTPPARPPEQNLEADETTPHGKLKRIATAVQKYHDAHDRYPHASIAFTGDTGLSWRVWILPHLDKPELTKLYNQFRLNQPWDSPNNIKLAAQMPDVFKTPGVSEPDQTAFHVFTGAGTPLGDRQPVAARDITDGTANTIMAVVGNPATATVWTRPGGIAFSRDTSPAADLAKIDGKFLIVTMSGDVRRVRADLPREAWPILVERADGENAQLAELVERLDQPPPAAPPPSSLSRAISTLFGNAKPGKTQSHKVGDRVVLISFVEVDVGERAIQGVMSSVVMPGDILVVTEVEPTRLGVATPHGTAFIEQKAVIPLSQVAGFWTGLIRSDPREILPYAARGMAYHELGDYEKALADFRTALRLERELAKGDRHAREDGDGVSDYIDRGLAWKVRRDHYSALATPAHAGGDGAPLSPLIAKALMLEDEGRYHAAMLQYNDVIRRNPRDATAYFHRGNAFANQGSNDKAIADYNKSISLNPSFAAAYLNRGATSAEQGDYERALADYSEAIRLDPQQPDAHNSQAWIWATCPDARFRDGKKAVASATRACELDEWINPANLDTLAAAYAEAGEFASAIKWQTKATEMEQDRAEKVEFRMRLDLYRSGKPYRQRPRPGTQSIR